MSKKSIVDKIEVNRRGFLKSSAFLGGSVMLMSQLGCVQKKLDEMSKKGELSKYVLAKPEHVIYSVCLQCHTACNIKCKVYDGVLHKIDGNPYSAQNMYENLPYNTPVDVAARIDGKICPKGQAGVQTLYDPYRIVKVLKRAGKRGENKWKAIPFEQAVKEIVEGGYLFKDVPGEENRKVEGLKDIFKVRDPKLMKQMAKDAKALAEKKMSWSEFKSKYAGKMDLFANPDHPDAGPYNNKFVFMAGRIEHGRKEFMKRFMKDCFGSVNFYEHTTICEQSHHIGFAEMFNGKHHLKPDLMECKFVIYFGTGGFEANFGPPPISEKLTAGYTEKNMKIAVVDPRMSKTAAKADYWVPIRPGTDAAFALAMGRYIIETGRYDKKYLSAANYKAAYSINETTFTNSTWLVKIEKDGPGAFLKPSEIGLSGDFVVMKDGKPVAGKKKGDAVFGDLFVDTVINGIKVKSAFQIYYDSTKSRTLKEWADLCDVPVEQIITLAREFTSYGKKAAIDFYRGPVQHTNGYYNATAIIALNLLIGNVDWAGGLSVGGGHWHEYGGKKGNPFNMKKLVKNKLGTFGYPVTREKTKYEKTTFFNGYPAKRPFYPFTGNVYQEIIPSAYEGYPYDVKCLMIHKGTPAFASPAGHVFIEMLKDVNRIPLLIGSDIVIGETTMYCDYIFPDKAIWERWGFSHPTPDNTVKVSKIRQPVVNPMTDKTKVYGQEVHLGMETLMYAIAEQLNLPGFGKDGFGPGLDNYREEDFYLKLAENIAMEGAPVPDADAKEIDVFFNARKHLTKAAFDVAKVKESPNWKKIVYVLNRGGRFEHTSRAHKGDKLAYQYKKDISLYVESVAQTRDSMTGKRFYGYPVYVPAADMFDRPLKQDGYDLHLISYKEITGGQSRTSSNYWMLDLYLDENFIWMNSKDADRLGLSDGDTAKIVSPTNPDGVWDLKNGMKIKMIGKVKVSEAIKPGTVAVSWHYGHWAYGSHDVVVDGKVIKGDKRRATGLCPNAAMLVDPVLKNMCLTDKIGGSASFYDTHVKVVKA
ncbi:molybdopterin oxidoreductase [Deferribacter autotrophicus]|uniref:Molybdopterin oxidoreductase n=1 Tax=Deferribacter autotrophicus TaxID=500465 RepID=A0A5A8F609_9BACT|nr:molybdopterin-dependent oxidoreductase [Deferribacter autotrophicus]KAA0258164.1 molybdopterin oxidoreductase [Deferribacter autotrophicus]